MVKLEMAKEYFEKLTSLVTQLNLNNSISANIEIKHFFSGAAFYIDNTTCASWSPAGLAFKLSEKETIKLISSGKAIPLKYFAKGHIKKGYALFENPANIDPTECRNYFIKAAVQVSKTTK